MRLLTVGNRYPPWSLGGYEAIWESANRALRARGHEVRVLTTGPDPSEEPGTRSQVADVNRELRWYWRNHRFPPIGWREMLELERHNARVLDGMLAGFRPDAVIWWAMGGMSLSLLERPHRAGVPAAGVVGDEWMLYGPQVDAWTRTWRHMPWPAALSAGRLTGISTRVRPGRCGRWLFMSDFLRAEVLAGGVAVTDSVIAHPGVDPRRFTPHEAVDWEWRLLYCGRLDPRKGVSTAVQTLALLPSQATLTLHGGGDEDYVRELRELAARLGLAERVSFSRGPHEAVATVYAAADVVLFPVVWREPWGLVPLEAMAIGRPVVASTAEGGMAEYLEDDRNCLRATSEDPAAFAQAVRTLASEPARREAIVRAGRGTAERFSEQRFHDQLEAEVVRVASRQLAT